MKTFILTLQFLTRIPININIEAGRDDFAKGVVYFPMVGLIIGAFNVLMYYIATKFADGIFPLICCVLANIMITGALHIDGLADTCDGIYSSRTRDKMLEIMKDSRIGTNGAIAIVFDFLLRISLLGSLENKTVIFAMLLSPVVAKTLVVVLMQISVYARSAGMGGLFLGKQNMVRTVIAVIIGLLTIFYFIQYEGLIIFLICAVCSLLYRSYIYKKIDGMTGDTLGAANEVIEIMFLLCFAIVGRYNLL